MYLYCVSGFKGVVFTIYNSRIFPASVVIATKYRCFIPAFTSGYVPSTRLYNALQGVIKAFKHIRYLVCSCVNCAVIVWDIM